MAGAAGQEQQGRNMCVAAYEATTVHGNGLLGWMVPVALVHTADTAGRVGHVWETHSVSDAVERTAQSFSPSTMAVVMQMGGWERVLRREPRRPHPAEEPCCKTRPTLFYR